MSKETQKNSFFYKKKRPYLLLILSLFVMLFLVQSLNAQGSLYPGIDSMKILPLSPVSTSEVEAILYTKFNNGPATLDSTKMSINMNTITLTAFYFTSGYSYVNNREDTISLGILSEGNYTLKAIFVDSNLVGGTVTDTRIINFYVGTLSIQKNKTFSNIKLYPNPANNQLHFSIPANANNLKVTIVAISGRKIKTISYNSAHAGAGVFQQSIDISNLSQGLYLCEFNYGGKQATRKFIKQ